VFYLFFLAPKTKVGLKDLKFEFCQFKLSRITDKLVINWQNFARVRLQFSFFYIRPKSHKTNIPT